MTAGDVKVSTDGGAEADITTLPVVTPAGSKRIKITLSASEMNGDNIQVTFSDAAGSEWCDLTINIQTTAVQIDDLVRSTTPANTLDIAVTGEAGIDFSNTNGTHPVVGTVTNVTNDVGITQAGADKVWSSATRTLTSFGTLVSDIWSAGTRTLTSFGTLISDIWAAATRTLTAGTRDTEIDAIKIKTDNLPADTSALLDRLLGLSFENYFIDTFTFDTGQVATARMRTYTDAASVGTDNNVLATYNVTAVYSSGQIVSHKVVKV